MSGSFGPEEGVVMVAHSLYGLILKQVCIELAKTENDRSEGCLKNIRGVVFYATPHGGTDLELLYQDQVMKYLWRLSNQCGRLNEDFRGLCRKHHWKTLAFYETLPIPFFRMGPIVNKASACFGMDRCEGVYANHETICRSTQGDLILRSEVTRWW